MNRQERHRIGVTDAGARLRTAPGGETVAIEVVAAILGVRAAEPVVAVVPSANEDSLPCGPFRPSEHRTLEGGTRAWIDAQTGVHIGLLQHLHASGESADVPGARAGTHTVCISYLALVGPGQCSDRTPATWRSWYTYFPWEDWRRGKPACLPAIEHRLNAWASQPDTPCAATLTNDRAQRLRIAFGTGAAWDEEKVLERYELMQEAGVTGLVAAAGAGASARPMHALRSDHALLLARAIGDLRRAVKFRPVVFELMQEAFTLFEFQRAVEAILGPNLHKQNFRRLVESCGLVEPAGDVRLRTGGRPARLYRFRRDVVFERTSPGVRLKTGRA
jgi:hypothetical protein